jgi:glutamate-1-semialdehyde 2,1-aminomutase
MSDSLKTTESSRSATLFARASQLFPGGVNSPVRAFGGVGGTPVFFERGEGATLVDVDGRRYVDYVGSWGPLILGHAVPAVREAIAAQAARGTSFGAPHPGEIALAEAVQAAMPWLEMMRFTSSGSEATAAALRLARGVTGRSEVIKFDGCYHGAVDSFLVKAGSGVETLGLPDSPGVPAAVAALTHTVPFNDLAAATELLRVKGADIACVIVEPVVGNMGVIAPQPGFLEGLRDACRQAGVLLVMDEVMTGFRLARGGAQELLGVRGDLTTFGKVIGGGLPVGAVGGSRALMQRFAPSGPIYQAGTLSGNPLATAAGVATLEALSAPGVYGRLEATGQSLAQGLLAACREARIPCQLNRVGSMWTLFFTETPVVDAASARTADRARYAKFFHGMLELGIYLPPSQFEAAFISLAHGPAELTATLAAAQAVLPALH